MIHQRRVAMTTLCMAVAFTAGCKKDPPPAVAPTPATTATTTAPVRTPAQIQASQDSAIRVRMINDSIQRVEAARRERAQLVADSTARAATMAANNAREAEAMRATIATAVHFDFDKYELREDTKQALDAKIPILNANPALTIRLAGHTDNRGSGEYNLQLGQRRAAAARDYLTARGVAPNRIELVSYGEERPVCQSNDESCWAQNRRSEFEITAGGTTLRRP
jgi:peptidoglycan-associated lipoprotein